MRNLFVALLLIVGSQSLAQIPTVGLLGHWKFDGTAQDESVNGNDGMLMNGASFAIDRFGGTDGALRLVAAQQQYVNVPNHSSLQVDQALSISFWAKRSTFGPGIIDQVLNKGGDWNTGTCNYGLVFSDNTLVFLHNSGYHGLAVPGIPPSLLVPYTGSLGSALPGAPQDDEWHHYVVTTSHGALLAKFYVDSVWMPSFFDGNGQEVHLNPVSEADLHIGGMNYFSNNTLDDIRIYGSVLTSEDVAALFMEGVVTGIRSGKLSSGIHPNPGNGLFTLDHAASAGAQLTVLDMMGREVHHEMLEGTRTQIDLTSGQKGVYVYRILDGASVSTGRFIVQ